MDGVGRSSSTLTHRPRYDVNCAILFPGPPIEERARLAPPDSKRLRSGGRSPEAVPPDRVIGGLARSISDASVTLAGFNFFAGDMPRW